jgi:mono/diheme cytochrome c family protein
MNWKPVIVVMAALSVQTVSVNAQAVLVQQGRVLAEINCAKCHALDQASKSPHDKAPPFRDVAAWYGPGELEDGFMDGLAVAHPDMPDWDMTNDQAKALAAFIMSFKPN